jgi:threonine/homoserine efflux transporter RhtA
MVEPVTASLFGVAFLNERLAGVQIVGMGLILATVTALSAFPSRDIGVTGATGPARG